LNGIFVTYPGLSLRENAGLKLANAFGVFKLNHYPDQESGVIPRDFE